MPGLSGCSRRPSSRISRARSGSVRYSGPARKYHSHGLGSNVGGAPKLMTRVPGRGGAPGGRAAEAHDRRPGLDGDRVAVDLRVGQVDVGPGGRVEGLAVEDETGRAAE